MRILLDNCIPVDLAPHIRGHTVKTAVEMGFNALDDGSLLDAMSDQFDVLVTVDKSLPLQQALSDRPFAVIVLNAKNNRVGQLARLMPALQRVLKSIAPGEVCEISV